MSFVGKVEGELRSLLSGGGGSIAILTSDDPGIRALVHSKLVATLSSDDIEKQARARVLFIDCGYLDETVRTLSTGSPPLQVEAAHTLALAGSRRATPSLIAALFDRSAEVQRAAAEALLQIRDPSVASDFVQSKFLDSGGTESRVEELSAETTLPTADLGPEGPGATSAAGPASNVFEADLLADAETTITSRESGFQAAPIPSGYDHTTREITTLATHAKSEAAEAISRLSQLLSDSQPQALDGAITALYEFEPPFGAGLINRLIDEGSPALREDLGRALVSSGLAGRALDSLGEGNPTKARDALHLLQLLIKTDQFDPLVSAIEEHRNVDVRRAVIKLLNLAGQGRIANQAAQRRLDLITR